jgi:hypothetical protein
MSRRALLFLGVLAFNGVQKGAVESFLPGLDRAFRLLVVGGDAVVILLAATVLLRNRSFYGTRVWLLFLFTGALTILYNLEYTSVALQLSGLREPLFFLSCLIIVHDILSSEEDKLFVGRMTLFILVFAVLQVPVSIYQFARYGPSDYVGGTFGWGGPGLVSLLAFLSTFYLLVHRAQERGDEAIHVPALLLYAPLLIPCLINETKISFIILPVFLVLLSNVRRASQLVPLLLLGAVLFGVLNYLYSENVQDTGRLLDEDFLERYLFYDRREAVDMPRFQKLAVSTGMLADAPGSLLVGMGYGAFTGGNILEASEFREKYYYLFGARMFVNTILVQGGILGALAYLWGTLGFFPRRGAAVPVLTNRLRWFLAIIVCGIWLYTDAFLQRTFAGITAFISVWVFHQLTHAGPFAGTDEPAASESEVEE